MSKKQNNDNGMAVVDFENGRGFGPMAAGLTTDFLQGNKKAVLTTIAFLFTHPNPLRVNTYCQAITMLALFASGALVSLTKQQFRRLERTVKDYESYMRGLAQPLNESLAAYVRKQSVRRAKTVGII